MVVVVVVVVVVVMMMTMAVTREGHQCKAPATFLAQPLPSINA